MTQSGTIYWRLPSVRPSRKMRRALCFLMAALTLVAAGCGEDMRKASLTEEEIRERTFVAEVIGPGELFVSGEKVTCQDVLAARAEEADMEVSFKQKLEELAATMELKPFTQAAGPILTRRLKTNITNIVLYKRAERQFGDQIDERLEDVAESELRKFVLEHGGNNARADEALKAIGMNRVTFKERRKKEVLAENLLASKISRNRPITYSEIAVKYDELKDAYFVKPAMVQFRLIDIQIMKVELADPNDDPRRKARVLAESLVTRLCAGEDFAALAEEYSHGRRAAEGGLWDPRDPDTLAAPYEVLPEWAEKIEIGQIAGPIETPTGYFIMKLVDRRPRSYLPLPEVQDQIERRIRVDRRVEDLAKIEAEIESQIEAMDTGPFVDYCLEQLHATVNAPAPTSEASAGEEPAP